MNVKFAKSFDKAFKRVFKKAPQRQEHFFAVLELFMLNPYHPKLETHKLSGKLKGNLSFTVEYDIRVVFYFENKDTAVFVSIGSHDQVY